MSGVVLVTVWGCVHELTHIRSSNAPGGRQTEGALSGVRVKAQLLWMWAVGFVLGDTFWPALLMLAALPTKAAAKALSLPLWARKPVCHLGCLVHTHICVTVETCAGNVTRRPCFGRNTFLTIRMGALPGHRGCALWRVPGTSYRCFVEGNSRHFAKTPPLDALFRESGRDHGLHVYV
jgi:hypothetical protein